MSVGIYQSKHQARPKHTHQCKLPGKCMQAHRESRGKRRHAATVDYPCYGYTSIVDQLPFSLWERNMYFEKFNMIFSGPDYFKNNILTMVDGRVLKHITEALFQIYKLQSLVVGGRRGRGEWGSGNRTVSSLIRANTSRAPQTSKAIDRFLGTGFPHVFVAMHTFTYAALTCSCLTSLTLTARKMPFVTLALLATPGLMNHLPFFLQRGTGFAITGAFPNPP